MCQRMCALSRVLGPCAFVRMCALAPLRVCVRVRVRACASAVRWSVALGISLSAPALQNPSKLGEVEAPLEDVDVKRRTLTKIEEMGSHLAGLLAARFMPTFVVDNLLLEPIVAASASLSEGGLVVDFLKCVARDILCKAAAAAGNFDIIVRVMKAYTRELQVGGLDCVHHDCACLLPSSASFSQ